MRAHVIETGLIANTVVVNALDALPGLVLIDADLHPGNVGDGWDGSSVIPAPQPAPVVPAEITMRQARLALLGAGLLASVGTAINAMPEPQRSAARIEWDYSSAVQRHNGFVQSLGPALGLTESQIDDLFRVAVTL